MIGNSITESRVIHFSRMTFGLIRPGKPGQGRWEDILTHSRYVVPFLAAAGLVLGVSLSDTASQAAEIVKYQVTGGESIAKSLTGKPGDPKAGRKAAINKKQGNCLACHVMPIPEQTFHGEVGPDLNGVGDRYSPGELRLRIVDPKIVNPDTIMPAFYKKDGLHRVLKKFQGKTILSAQQVEDIVAYLTTLK